MTDAHAKGFSVDDEDAIASFFGTEPVESIPEDGGAAQR